MVVKPGDVVVCEVSCYRGRCVHTVDMWWWYVTEDSACGKRVFTIIYNLNPAEFGLPRASDFFVMTDKGLLFCVARQFKQHITIIE